MVVIVSRRDNYPKVWIPVLPTDNNKHRLMHRERSRTRERDTRTIHIPDDDNASKTKRTQHDSRLSFILVPSSGSCLSPLKLATRRALRTRRSFSSEPDGNQRVHARKRTLKNPFGWDQRNPYLDMGKPIFRLPEQIASHWCNQEIPWIYTARPLIGKKKKKKRNRQAYAKIRHFPRSLHREKKDDVAETLFGQASFASVARTNWLSSVVASLKNLLGRPKNFSTHIQTRTLFKFNRMGLPVHAHIMQMSRNESFAEAWRRDRRIAVATSRRWLIERYVSTAAKKSLYLYIRKRVPGN